MRFPIRTLNFFSLLGLFFKIATSEKKIFLIYLKLHELRNQTIADYTGGFETISDDFIGEHKPAAALRFKNIGHYESYIFTIDKDYADDVDTIFTGQLYRVNTPEYNILSRSEYGKGTDFKINVVEVIGNF